MSKHRVGLHKKVTAIFGNLAIVKDSDAQQPSDVPIPQRPAPKPPAPSHMTPTKPKPKEPVQPPPPPPKTAPAKQPKAKAAVKEILEAPILGMIPEDSLIQEALNQKDAIVHTHPKSKSARAYKEIAAKILTVEYDSDQDRESFWRRFLNKFKRYD